MTKIDVLAVMDKAIDSVNMRISPEHAAWNAELREARAAVAELIEAHKRLLAMAERLDLAEGVCCCGDDMQSHPEPMSCGHSPVDAGHYHHGATIEESRAALARIGETK